MWKMLEEEKGRLLFPESDSGNTPRKLFKLAECLPWRQDEEEPTNEKHSFALVSDTSLLNEKGKCGHENLKKKRIQLKKKLTFIMTQKLVNFTNISFLP